MQPSGHREYRRGDRRCGHLLKVSRILAAVQSCRSLVALGGTTHVGQAELPHESGLARAACSLMAALLG
jgi:hypothetical protein